VQPVLCVATHSEEETRGVARTLAKLLTGGDCLVLSGQLGAGKTVFVRGLAEGLGIDPAKVHSPSFTVLNEYRGEPSVYHFDLYRLTGIDELTETGWDDYLSRDGVVVVEWGERAAHRLPARYYQVTMTPVDDSTRKIDITLEGA
jgi:tRNA threonylcarbamoyladenosine biosynthesis protein TsaE